MRHASPIVAVCMLVSSAVPGRADAGAIEAILRSVLAERDDSRLPSLARVGGEWTESVGSLTPGEVQVLLPLARECLLSDRTAIQPFGIGFFFDVAIRMDGSSLVAPYLDDIAPLLKDPRVGYRNSAIFILGSSNPAPIPGGLAYLAAHLGDKTDTPEQVMMVAGALLTANPDAGNVHRVLEVVQQRPDLDKGRLIGILGVARARSDEALAFIRGGFADRNPGIRMASVEAVGKLPRDLIRGGLTAELQQIIADPDATAELRDRARQVLIQ